MIFILRLFDKLYTEIDKLYTKIDKISHFDKVFKKMNIYYKMESKI